jgi:hypothetical protein
MATLPQVLLGHLELATMLWRRTHTPMRAAVMTSRLCRKLTEKASEVFAEELLRAADTFEDHAVGILDQVSADHERPLRAGC